MLSHTLPTMMLQSSISNNDEEVQNEFPMEFILEFFCSVKMIFLHTYMYTCILIKLVDQHSLADQYSLFD